MYGRHLRLKELSPYVDGGKPGEAGEGREGRDGGRSDRQTGRLCAGPTLPLPLNSDSRLSPVTSISEHTTQHHNFSTR